jgi:hypothetical protein
MRAQILTGLNALEFGPHDADVNGAIDMASRAGLGSGQVHAA